MAENSKIEWTHHTFNPWIGCTKVSPGCDHCYAETQNNHRQWNPGGWTPGADRKRTSVTYWRQPLKWDREAAAVGERRRVFCASLADVFDNQIPNEWRNDLWSLIAKTPNLDWLLLTKRPQNIANMLPVPFDFEKLYPNVWLGTTVENQEEAARRLPHLLSVPAKVHFVSCEPLLGEVRLDRVSIRDDSVVYGAEAPALALISWVICGGESGKGARPMHPDWARSLRDQCKAAGVPFHFKQHGEWVPLQAGEGYWPSDADTCIRLLSDGSRSPDGWPMQRVGKKFAGRLLDGVTHDEFPAPSRAI